MVSRGEAAHVIRIGGRVLRLQEKEKINKKNQKQKIVKKNDKNVTKKPTNKERKIKI